MQHWVFVLLLVSTCVLKVQLKVLGLFSVVWCADISYYPRNKRVIKIVMKF